MNVNETVRINNLARELLKHGLVSTLDDGIEKAKEMTRDGVDIGGVQDAQLKTGGEPQQLEPEEPAQEQTPEQPPEEQPSEVSDQSNDLKIMERKLNYLAKSFAEQFNSEMDGVKKQIEMLNNDLKDIKGKIKQGQAQPQEPQQKLETEDSPKEQKKDDEEVKPRTGDLTPDDVDLENYFYFGNKKK